MQKIQYYIGNTKIIISTDYCENKTKEEVEEILASMVRIAKSEKRSQERTE